MTSLAPNIAVVTGSSGFIGTHLCAALCRPTNGRVSFTGLDITAPRLNGYTHLQTDIRNLQALDYKGNAPVVFHLAANAEVVLPLKALAGLVEVNVLGTLNILVSLRPEVFIFASSSAVYGNGGKACVGPGWTNVNPVGAYGMSKAMAEL